MNGPNLSKRKVKILFSNKQGWIRSIQKGFQSTTHEITFQEFSSEKIKDYDLVVPLTIRDARFLNEIRDLIADNPIPIPSNDNILLCNDKYLFNQELTRSGFSELIPEMGDRLSYPYILKKKIDEWGQNSHIISDEKHEQIFADILASPGYFTQEIIAGPNEYATHILFKDKEILCSLNIKYAFEKNIPIKGKDKPIYKINCHCPYINIFSSVLRSIGFEGLCCINYKVRDNRPWILEINPRCGASLCPYLFSFVECAI